MKTLTMMHEHNAIFRVECVCDPPELHPEFRMLPNSSVIQADSAHAAPGPVRVDVERRAAGNPERATASRWTHLGIASARWACVSRTLLRRRSPLRVAWWPPVGSAVDQAGASPGTTVGRSTQSARSQSQTRLGNFSNKSLRTNSFASRNAPAPIQKWSVTLGGRFTPQLPTISPKASPSRHEAEDGACRDGAQISRY